jgi:hypothetical protein
MENNYSNYDMLDKLIGNNKKAKSWTAFWMIMLCLMAGAVLWLAYTVSEKNKTISLQGQIIETSEFNLEVKSRIIDSLTENCNDAKTEIVKSCDSVITQTQTALQAIVSTENTAGTPVQISAVQQARIREATRSIQAVKTNLYNVQTAITKNNTKLFVQYNNTENAAQVSRFLSVLKRNSDYVIAPAEYVDKSFSTVIKFYNYTNTDEEKKLTTLIARQFNIDNDKILVKHEKNINVKNIVEIWIGTRPLVIRAVQLKRNKP